MVYVKDKFNIKPCNELNNLPYTEVLWCYVEDHESILRILFGAVYRKSTLGNLNDNNLLNLMTLASNLCKDSLILFSDFNLPTVDWD